MVAANQVQFRFHFIFSPDLVEFHKQFRFSLVSSIVFLRCVLQFFSIFSQILLKIYFQFQVLQIKLQDKLIKYVISLIANVFSCWISLYYMDSTLLSLFHVNSKSHTCFKLILVCTYRPIRINSHHTVPYLRPCVY